MAEQSLLATMTGEHFQPVRLHYKVLNRSGLLTGVREASLPGLRLHPETLGVALRP